MEYYSSISYVVSNLLIGLCKNSKLLGEYSEIFHNQLGYEFFRLELSFALSNGRKSVPEAIVYSEKLGYSLLFEWTESNDPVQKQDQLNRYSQITTIDLLKYAAIPKGATQKFDIALVLRPMAVDNFTFQINSYNQDFPILVFEKNEQFYSLCKKINSFKEIATDQFFQEGVYINRLPRYLPFSLETCNPKELVPFVVTQFTKLLVTGETVFSLLDFCRGFIKVWDFIGNEKKKEVMGVVKSLINDMIKKKWCIQIAKRNQDNPQTWDLSPEIFKKNPRGYRNHFNRFITEVRQESYQLSFDF